MESEGMVTRLLVDSEGFLDEALERARDLVEGYEMWRDVVERIRPDSPVILSMHGGEVLAVEGLSLSDAKKPAHVFEVNETVSIRIPSERPKRFVAA